MPDNATPPPPFHAGESEAQELFNADWSTQRAQRLARIIGTALDETQAAFIEGLGFFFLATADAEGRCDCSFRGTECGEDNEALSAARVAEPRRLLFPDYAGNKMFNSLGNILVNPHVGMIFIDFGARRRLRVNGAARILSETAEWRTLWPAAERAVEVDIEQVYWNCSKRIPPHP